MINKLKELLEAATIARSNGYLDACEKAFDFLDDCGDELIAVVEAAQRAEPRLAEFWQRHTLLSDSLAALEKKLSETL